MKQTFQVGSNQVVTPIYMTTAKMLNMFPPQLRRILVGMNKTKLLWPNLFAYMCVEGQDEDERRRKNGRVQIIGMMVLKAASEVDPTGIAYCLCTKY